MHVVLRESRIQIQDQSFFDLSVTDPDPDLDPVCLRRRRTFRLVGRVPGSAASTWIFPHGSGVTRPFAFFGLCASLVKKSISTCKTTTLEISIYSKRHFYNLLRIYRNLFIKGQRLGRNKVRELLNPFTEDDRRRNQSYTNEASTFHIVEL